MTTKLHIRHYIKDILENRYANNKKIQKIYCRLNELLHTYVLRIVHVDLELKYGPQKLKEQPVNVLVVLMQNYLF